MSEIIEEVLVRLKDGKLTVTGVGVEPINDRYELRSARMCKLMALAIGQELGETCDEESAVRRAARLSFLTLEKLSETLEAKEADYEAN